MIALSKSEECIPSKRTFFSSVFDLWKRKPENGRFYYQLLDCSRVSRVEFPNSLGRKTIDEILKRLGKDEYFDRIFAEGAMQDQGSDNQWGCLVLGHRQPNGQPGYYSAIYDSEDFEKCFYASLIPGVRGKKGRISILATSGWQDLSSYTADRIAAVRVMLTTFKDHLDRIEPRTIPVGSLGVEDGLMPPDDPGLLEKFALAYSGYLRVTLAIVPMTQVVPHSIDFCSHYSPDSLSGLTARIRCGFKPSLAVYWDGRRFIMSDDYPTYLAYTRVGTKNVTVAIVGDFPEENVEVLKVGGGELLPPVTISWREKAPDGATEDFKLWQLQEKFQTTLKSAIPGDLIAVWMVFADLLNDRKVSERELHNFIVKHPEVFSAYGTSIESEVWLGKKYRIDLVVRAGGIRDEITLVELENHRHEVFTRSGQPRAELTHALQQVQDWFRWIRENPTHSLYEATGGIPPRGMVVAGRSIEMNQDDRDRLAHLNSGAPVPIITYDELLNRFGDLILSRLDNGDA